MSVLLWWLGLVGLCAALLYLTYRQPPRATLRRTLPPSGFAGSRLPLQLTLQLQSRWPTRVLLEDATPRHLVSNRVLALSALCWGQLELQTQAELTLNKYGVYTWPAARLHWADPLGLFWHSQELLPENMYTGHLASSTAEPLTAAPTTLEVYPQPHSLLLPDLLRPLLSEGQLSRSLGLEDPLSLRGLRDYLPGDPPGKIQWRLTAHTGKLTVRELEYTAASSLTVYLDLSGASELFVESAVRLATSILQEAQTLGLPAAVATPGHITPSGNDITAYRAALLALTHAQAQPGGEPAIPPTRAGGNLIILTETAGQALLSQAMRARAAASRVSLVALPEGFYLEPGEKPRPQWVRAPERIRELEAQSGVLAGAGILVFILRGNQSVLRLAASDT